MAKTRAQLNRELRQETLREQLAAQGHEQHVLEMLEDLRNLERELDTQEVNRIKIVIDTKLKLLNKYLPDLKATEITGDLSVSPLREILDDISGVAPELPDPVDD